PMGERVGAPADRVANRRPARRDVLLGAAAAGRRAGAAAAINILVSPTRQDGADGAAVVELIGTAVDGVAAGNATRQDLLHATARHSGAGGEPAAYDVLLGAEPDPRAARRSEVELEGTGRQH